MDLWVVITIIFFHYTTRLIDVQTLHNNIFTFLLPKHICLNILLSLRSTKIYLHPLLLDLRNQYFMLDMHLVLPTYIFLIIFLFKLSKEALLLKIMLNIVSYWNIPSLLQYISPFKWIYAKNWPIILRVPNITFQILQKKNSKQFQQFLMIMTMTTLMLTYYNENHTQ